MVTELYLHEPLDHYGLGSGYTALYKDGTTWVKKATFVGLTQEMVLIARVDGIEDVLTIDYLEGDVLQRLTDKVEAGGDAPVGKYIGNLYGVGTVDGVEYYVCSSEYLAYLVV